MKVEAAMEESIGYTMEKLIECLRCYQNQHMPMLLDQDANNSQLTTLTHQQRATILSCFLIMHWARNEIMPLSAEALAGEISEPQIIIPVHREPIWRGH